MTSPSAAIRFVSVVALLNVAALAVLGVIANRALDNTQRNGHRIEVAAYKGCLIRNANIARLNALYDGIIDIERHNPYVKTSPATVKARIDLYTAAHLDTYRCGRRP